MSGYPQPMVFKKKDIMAAMKDEPEKGYYNPRFRPINPTMSSTGITTTMEMKIERILPGKDRPAHMAHRHANEAVFIILKGKGYSILDGKRYDWEEGDIISLPGNAWHQHFNLDPENEVIFIAITNGPLIDLLKMPSKFKADHKDSEEPTTDASYP